MVAQCHPGHTGQPQALKGQASVEGCHPLPEANLERPARPLLLEEAPLQGRQSQHVRPRGQGRSPGQMWLRQGRASKSSGTTSQLWTDAVPRAGAYRPCPRARGPPPAHVAPCAQESPCARGWEHPPGHPAPPRPYTSPGLVAPSVAIPTLCRPGAPHSKPPVGPRLRPLP